MATIYTDTATKRTAPGSRGAAAAQQAVDVATYNRLASNPNVNFAGQTVSGRSSGGGTATQLPVTTPLANYQYGAPASFDAKTGLLTIGGQSLQLPKVDTTLASDRLGQVSVNTLNMQTAPLTAGTSLVAGMPTTLAPTEPQTQDQPPMQTPSLKDKIMGMFGANVEALGKQDEYRRQLESQYKINENTQKLAELQGIIQQRTSGYLSQFQAAENKAIPSPFIVGEQTQIQRTQAVEIGMLNAQAQALQGNIESANDIIDRTMKYKFEPLIQQNQSLMQMYSMVQNDMSESEKMQAQANIDKDRLAINSLYNAQSDALKSLADRASKGEAISSSAYTAVGNANSVSGVYQALGQNAPSTVIDTSTQLTDPNSSSILAQTGLSPLAFAYATQGSPALTRLPAEMRQKYINEWGNYQKAHNIDGATFQSQYEALSKTIGANLLRNNQASVAEAELAATVDNLTSAGDEADFKKLRWYNVAKLFAGQEVNDPAVTKYAFHLEQLRNEFALYNAALAGQIDANGNIRDITADDYRRADLVLKNGIDSGSLTGFRSALEASTGKMRTVLNASIDAVNKQVWDLFGVGGNFKFKTPINTTETQTWSSTTTSILEKYGVKL